MVWVAVGFTVAFTAFLIWGICQPNPTSYMSPQAIKDCDFRACEQMRESGWSEAEVEKFCRDTDSYYDKDYE